MKKNGFTLIELLSVIIVLAVLVLLVVPITNKQMSSSKNKLYLSQVTLIEKAAKEWGTENNNALPTHKNDLTYIGIADLNQSGLIDRKIAKDPRTNKEMKGCVTIGYDEEHHQNYYKYIDTPCSNLSIGDNPIITIAGGNPQGVEVNTEYRIPEVSAKDKNGDSLSVDGPVIRNPQNKVVDRVVTSTVRDLYTLTYRAKDPVKNTETEINLIVKVIDTKPPVIVVNGKGDSHTIKKEAGSGFTVPTAVVTDNSKITCSTASGSKCLVTISSNVNTNILGTYRVTYTATDDGEYLSGPHKNISIYTLTVKVIDTTPPVINSIVANTVNWTNQNITLTVNATDFIGVTDYSFDNGKTWQKSNQKSYATNQAVTVRTKDGSGNISQPKSYTISNIDKIIPTCSSSGGSTTWTPQNKTITGTCSDTGGSGCRSNVTRTFTSNTDGIYSPGTIYDNAGNAVQCPTTETIKIDKVAPTCSSSGGSTTWTPQNKTITGTCSDTGGSGCRSNVTRAFTSNTDGTYSPGTVYDNAGNSVTCAANQTVKIDKISPTCATSGGSTAWTSGDRKLVGTCSDTGGSGCRSNVESSYTSTTNGTYSPGTVYDNAGNNVVCSETTVKIDKTKPDIPTLNNNSGGKWVNWNVTVDATSSDMHSGMNRIEYSYNKIGILSFGASETINAGHVRGIWSGERGQATYIRAVDNVGNASAWASTGIYIDKTAPTVSISSVSSSGTGCAGGVSWSCSGTTCSATQKMNRTGAICIVSFATPSSDNASGVARYNEGYSANWDIFPIPPTNKQYTVSTTDVAGNTGATTSFTISFIY